MNVLFADVEFAALIKDVGRSLVPFCKRTGKGVSFSAL
jgi:hypothetical protein